MAAFLGIYSKTNRLNDDEIQPVIDDFTRHNKANSVTEKFPGMLLYTAAPFKSELYVTAQSVSYVSGHISFENIKAIETGSMAEKFGRCISTSAPTLLPALEGAFAALHYDLQTHTLTLANDKFGIFPLFIFEDQNYVIVSNDYQPLIQLKPAHKPKLDYDAIAEFFTLGITLGTKTFFKNIKNLPAASYAVVTEKKLTKQKYWQAKASPKINDDVNLLAEDLFKTFSKINREYADAHPNDIYLLTAGADSRLIIATLSEEQLHAKEFYTSNLSFLDPEEDKDVMGAVQLAEKFGLKHRVEKISFYENQFNTSYFDTERSLRARHLYGGWHGGELLGSFGAIAAPIKKELSFKDADKKLKTVLSWWTRLKLTSHPYKTYLKEKEKFDPALQDFLFITEQLTRSFFTNIYGGTQAYWAQPYQLTKHGFSPFWDSRFLQKLMQVPLNILADYALYNQLFKLCPDVFTKIGSNSPLTKRPDSVLPEIVTGIEPKSKIPDTHHQAYTERMANKDQKRCFFYRDGLKKILANEHDLLTRQWLDFETWYARYITE